MTVQGAECNKKTDPVVIAELTIRTMERSVHAAVPGIVFLSGGLSEEAASVYLNLMNKIIRKANWNIGFSYGRACSTLVSKPGKREMFMQLKKLC